MNRCIESDILSVCMLDSENLQAVIERGVENSWFDHEKHQRLFTELCKLNEEKSWDQVDGINIFEASGIFERNPIAEEIAMNTPDWSHELEQVQDAVEVLVTDYQRRKANLLLAKARAEINEGEDPLEVLAGLGGHIAELDNATTETADRTLKDIAKDAYKIDEKIANGESMGLPFPWQTFQERTFGIPIPSVTPLAGRDGKGKSRISRFLSHFWASNDIPGLYMPYEDGETRTISGLASINGGYDMFAIKRKFTPPEFMDNHKKHLDIVSDLPIKIIDYQATAERIFTQIAKAKRTHNIQYVIIDGFKDIVKSDGENQTVAESHIVSVLVRASKKFNVAIIPISHLTKVEDGQWLSKQNITGSGNQTKSARMVLVYQDSGISAGFKQNYPFDTEWGRCNVLQAQKASYGDEGAIVLYDEYETGQFIEIKKNEL